MGIEIEKATLPCGVCAAQVTELRRGRCWGCYLRWSDTRPVGRGAACILCVERRRDHLRLVELHSRSVPMCHGCSARAPIEAKYNKVRRPIRTVRIMLPGNLMSGAWDRRPIGKMQLKSLIGT